jgi:hypothetical protein
MAGAGTGLGAGLGGIASLSALPATVAEVAPEAMAQIGSAVNAATPATVSGGLGGGSTVGNMFGSAAGNGQIAGSAYGLGGVNAGAISPTLTGLGTELGTGLNNMTLEQLQAELAKENVLAEEVAKNPTMNETIAKQIQANPVSQIGTGQFTDPAFNSSLVSDVGPTGYDYSRLAQSPDTYTPGTSDLVRGGVNVPGEQVGIGKDIGSLLSQGANWIKDNPYKTIGAIGAYKLLNADKSSVPQEEKYKGPLSRFQYDPSRYTPSVAVQPAAYQSRYKTYAAGGIADLGHYSDGGQMLKGPGDGMSDSIPASIANKQPARLANEEFVVPADVVSHLGNGSSDAGAKQLYKMMDRVRQARTGNKKQGRQINASKFMPA